MNVGIKLVELYNAVFYVIIIVKGSDNDFLFRCYFTALFLRNFNELGFSDFVVMCKEINGSVFCNIYLTYISFGNIDVKELEKLL